MERCVSPVSTYRMSQRNNVAVGISYLEIGSAPRLFPKPLSELDAALEFFKKTLDIGDFDGSHDQGFLLRCGLCKEGVMHEADVQANGVTCYRPIKWRRTVKEVSFEGQLLSEEGGARSDITHEQDRDDVLQKGRARKNARSFGSSGRPPVSIRTNSGGRLRPRRSPEPG